MSEQKSNIEKEYNDQLRVINEKLDEATRLKDIDMIQWLKGEREILMRKYNKNPITTAQ